MRGEAEPVPQRCGQQPGSRGRADQGERRDIQRDGGRARPLPDHDVHAEILHGEVEHLLGRPCEPVDLVDEDDLALTQRGQHGGEVTGSLDRGAAGDPQRHAELGGNDHGDGRLAEPGRSRQQHVIGWPTTAQRALQHQRELVPYPLLADEIREPFRPQRALDRTVVGVGKR